MSCSNLILFWGVLGICPFGFWGSGPPGLSTCLGALLDCTIYILIYSCRVLPLGVGRVVSVASDTPSAPARYSYISGQKDRTDPSVGRSRVPEPRTRHQRPCRRPLRPERADLALWATPVHAEQHGGAYGSDPAASRRYKQLSSSATATTACSTSCGGS